MKFDENFERPKVLRRTYRHPQFKPRWFNISLVRFCVIIDLSNASKEEKLGECPSILNSDKYRPFAVIGQLAGWRHLSCIYRDYLNFPSIMVALCYRLRLLEQSWHVSSNLNPQDGLRCQETFKITKF